jgi:hypothetical protein
VSDTLKLASAMPGDDEINGLDSFAEALVDNPDGTTLTAVIIFDVKDVRYSPKTGAHVPTIQFRRGEAWLTEDTPQPVRDAMLARQEKRTGRTPLDFGVLEVTKSDD